MVLKLLREVLKVGQATIVYPFQPAEVQVDSAENRNMILSSALLVRLARLPALQMH